MKVNEKSAAYIFSLIFVAALTFLYLFIKIVLTPYWQELSGTELQIWWAGPFVRFSYVMWPVHLLSALTIITAYVLHFKEKKIIKIWWLLALIALFICQAFNFGVLGFVYNPSLQPGTLDAEVALKMFDNWDFYHTLRTIFICLSLFSLSVIGIIPKGKS
ncbi:MAG: hypothetical protein AAGB24_14215 [Bacteroidota bacterium]